jgi:hypothetical protein
VRVLEDMCIAAAGSVADKAANALVGPGAARSAA